MKSTRIEPICLLPAIILVLTLPLSGLSAEDNVGNSETEFAGAWNKIDIVAHRLMDEHISPPTRQQMILAACRGLFATSNKLPPRDLSKTFSKCVTDEDLQRELHKFWDEQSSSSQLDDEKLLGNAINAMLFDCEPGIVYTNAKDSRVQKQLAENQYVGIGIELNRTNDGWARITNPFYGGAAQKAGARVGDLIVAINGDSTKDQEFAKVVDNLRGSKGSQVVVSLKHETENVVRDLTMTRDVVPIASIVGSEQDQDNGKWCLAVDSHPDIAHLRFESIVGSTAAEMLQMARQIEKEKFVGVILDFRGLQNRSDMDIHHAIMLVDTLVSNQKIGELTTTDGSTEVVAQTDSVLRDIPMVVLADPSVPGPLFFTLSALVNSGRAKLVGSVVRSDGLCKKSVELGDGMGSLERVSYALAFPHEVESRKAADANTIHNQDLQSQADQLPRRFVLVPNSPVSPDQSENGNLLKTVVEALRE